SIGSAEGLPAFLSRLEAALAGGKMLVQFREPEWAAQADAAEVRAGLEAVLRVCRQAGAQCLVNSIHPQEWWALADGVHLRAQDAAALAAGEHSPAAGILRVPSEGNVPANGGQAPVSEVDPNSREYALTRRDAHLKPRRLVGVSAHNARDLETARTLQADFAVLGHVLETPSHAGQPPLGWEGFAGLAFEAGLPVYAIGGQSANTLPIAKQHGAHGVAGIRHILA